MRRRWHWDVFTRLTTLVRVRRVQQLAKNDMQGGYTELLERFREHDTGRIPRGFQHAWALVDVWLAEAAEAEALTYGQTTVKKGFAQTWHPVVVTEDRVAMQNGAFYGRAFWPKTRQVVDAAALAKQGPEQGSLLGTFAGFIMAINAAVVALMCCGIPVLSWIALASTEPRIAPASEG
jgi:hypothetical protein